MVSEDDEEWETVKEEPQTRRLFETEIKIKNSKNSYIFEDNVL